jgi:hypothetical protein
MNNESDKQTQAYQTVFNQQSEELRFIKNLEWKGVFYTVSAYAAVVSVALNFAKDHVRNTSFIAVFFILFIGELGWQYLSKTLEDIKRKRNILYSIVKNDKYLNKVYKITYFRNNDDEMVSDKAVISILQKSILIGEIFVLSILIYKICFPE